MDFRYPPRRSSAPLSDKVSIRSSELWRLLEDEFRLDCQRPDAETEQATPSS